jgi:uncharacterized protein
LIYVDANVPMYLVGAEHPNREIARRLVQRAIDEGECLFTSVEVLREILHRYSHIERRQAIQPCFDVLLELTDEVLAIELVDLQRAKEIVLTETQLSARDALHVAVMERHGLSRIMTFDTGFDLLPGIERIR